MEEIHIAELDAESAEALGVAFGRDEWNKSPSQYVKYLDHHRNQEILCLVAKVNGTIAGYSNSHRRAHRADRISLGSNHRQAHQAAAPGATVDEKVKGGKRQCAHAL
jgi:hypothetical protein